MEFPRSTQPGRLSRCSPGTARTARRVNGAARPSATGLSAAGPGTTALRATRFTATLLLGTLLTFDTLHAQGRAPASGSAPAAKPAFAKELRLLAVGECAATGAIERSVGARSARLRFGPSGAAVRVTLNAPVAGGPWTALIDFSDVDAAAGSRSISARDCASLIEATGFVIAVTLDPPMDSAVAAPNPAPAAPPSAVPGAPDAPGASSPNAARAAAGEPSAPPASVSAKPTTEATASALAPGAERAANAAQASSRSASPAVPFDPPDPIPREALAASYHASWVLGIGVHALSGAAPGALPGAAASLAWQGNRFAGFGWSPKWALSAGATLPRDWRSAGGVATFSLLWASLLACPLGAGTEPHWQLRACAHWIGGRVRAAGSDTLAAETQHRPWSALGGAAELDIGLGADFQLSLSASLGAPLARDSFQFEPSVFYRTDSVAAQLALSVGAVWR